MKADLEDLKITEKELENLSGFDVGEVFVGGIFGGVYRPSIFRSLKRSLSFWFTEIFVAVLTFIFTIPLGLAVTRDAATTINQMPVILRFLQITLGVTVLVMLSWNLYMWLRVKQLKTLMHLLNEVDQYHQVIGAIDILDRLESVTPINSINRSEVIDALSLARDTLVSGLMTEKILRESRALLSRRSDLLAHIEHNLVTLKTLELQDQSHEYGQLLGEALQIGISVHQEIQKSRSRPQ
jgi:hypothetical protein